jgi:hypothetical protein
MFLMTDIPTDTRIEKKSAAQKQAEASAAYASYQAEQAAKRENMLRLRAERLAREAANPPAGAKLPEAKPIALKLKPRKRIIRG